MEASKSQPSDILTQRRSKELDLLKHLPAGYKLHHKEINNVLLIQVALDTVKLKILEKLAKTLQFDILVPPNFPLASPKVRTLSTFATPSFADGRDLLTEVLGRKWTHTTTLFETILSIPSFITRYMEESKKKENKYKMYGEFHLGEKYDINDWMTMSSSAVYQCQEFPSDDLPPRHLYMVISESAFLLLEPDEKRKNKCVLTVCATLYALQKIERDLDTPNKIIFYWHRPDRKEQYKQELYVEKANHCISYLLAQVKKLGIDTERVKRNKHKFLEAEVTETTVKKVNIDKILAEIAEYEKMLTTDCSFDNIQILTGKYQQAIEYYSALGDEKFCTYLNKMKDLMKREEAQACLENNGAASKAS